MQTIERSTAPAPQPVRRRTRNRWSLVTAAATVMAVVAVVVIQPFGGGLAPDPAAASALRAAAAVAAARPAPAGGDIRHIVISGQDSAGGALIEDYPFEDFLVYVPFEREMWIAPDGSGTTIDTLGEPIFVNADLRRLWEEAGRPALYAVPPGETVTTDFEPGGLYYRDIASLPTDPDALAGVLEDMAADTDVPIDEEVFVIVRDVLADSAAGPELRAALFEVAARIPGIQHVGTIQDPAGRRGFAVALPWENEEGRELLVFDPNTSEILAEITVLDDPEPTSLPLDLEYMDMRTPAWISWTVYHTVELVDTLPTNSQ